MGAEAEGERGEEMRLWMQTIFMYVFNMFGIEGEREDGSLNQEIDLITDDLRDKDDCDI